MSRGWVMSIPEYGDVRVCSELITQLISYRQVQYTQPESGGVLIGKHLNSGGALLVDDYTRPNTLDQQERHSCFRSEEHNRVVNEIWLDSKGHSTYVGLWHTHPEAIPNYSSVDKKDWLSALNHSSYEGVRLFFVIVGQTHIRCWVGIKCLFRNKIELLGEFEIAEQCVE